MRTFEQVFFKRLSRNFFRPICFLFNGMNTENNGYFKVQNGGLKMTDLIWKKIKVINAAIHKILSILAL